MMEKNVKIHGESGYCEVCGKKKRLDEGVWYQGWTHRQWYCPRENKAHDRFERLKEMYEETGMEIFAQEMKRIRDSFSKNG